MEQLTGRALRVSTMRGAADADVRTVTNLDERISARTARLAGTSCRRGRERRLPAGVAGRRVVPGMRMRSWNVTGGTEH